MFRPGYVYAFQLRAPHWVVKVGRTIDPLGRLEQIQNQLPFELSVHSITYHKDAPRAEREAHKFMEEARIEGEWFDMKFSCVFIWLTAREREGVYIDIEEADLETDALNYPR